MSSTPQTHKHGPTWEVAHLFPHLGEWTESDFFTLHGNRIVELVDGCLEILPTPTWLHQLIVKYLVREVEAAATGEGIVMTAPLPVRLPVRLFEKTIREPDVMYFLPGSTPHDPRGYPTRVDLAMEVVSEGAEARQRDYIDKPKDYERAGVNEYWIVDPEDKKISVLVLDSPAYRLHGEFVPGDVASGAMLPALKISVVDVLRLGNSSE